MPVWLDDPAPALAPDSVLAGEGGGAGTAVGVVITILVLSLAITVTVYYRKRFHSLKTQLSHVHYSATGGGHQDYHQGPDRDQRHGSLLCGGGGGPHHFDNPVYATCRRDTGTGSLNNTTRLHNTIVKNVNRSREKERSLTLPAPRRVPGAGARLAEEAEEEMSDTISEKGLFLILFNTNVLVNPVCFSSPKKMKS